MSLQPSRPLTAAERDARRQNAQQSTGPRTPAGKRRSRLNATQHGHYARHYSEAFRETLLTLKEDPDQFDQLHQRLLGSFAQAHADEPVFPVLALAVEELAQLHWELDRERRRQNRMREQALAALDKTLEWRRAELLTEEFDRPGFQSGGLEATAPSPDRYKAILHYLGRLIDQVDREVEVEGQASRGDFDHYQRDLYLLYDDASRELSRVGERLKLLFMRCSGKYDSLPPADDSTVAELRALLVSEREKYAREYEAFKPTWPVISEEERERARQLQDLSEEEREELERSREREEWLRRAIDRKLRTILAVLREARLEEAHEARIEDRRQDRIEAKNHEPRAGGGGAQAGGDGRAGGGGRAGVRPTTAVVVARPSSGASRGATRRAAGLALPKSAGVSPAKAKSKSAEKIKNGGTNRVTGLESTKISERQREDPTADLAASTAKEAEPTA